MDVISNTTVLSNFAASEHLDLLRVLYPVLHISPEVYTEVHEGLDEGYLFYAAVDRVVYPMVESGWIRVTAMAEEEIKLLGMLPKRLHQGEASSLAIAKTRQWVLLTDDVAARKTAARMEIRFSGSLGRLALAVERGICSLSEANEWLAEMMGQGYHSPVTDLRPLLGRK